MHTKILHKNNHKTRNVSVKYRALKEAPKFVGHHLCVYTVGTPLQESRKVPSTMFYVAQSLAPATHEHCGMAERAAVNTNALENQI